MINQKEVVLSPAVPIVKEYVYNTLYRYCWVTEVTGPEYKLALASANNMWANTKKGVTPGRGFINIDSDPRRAERIGRLGEIALGKILSAPINLERIEKGDGGYDLVCGDLVLDIKTSHIKYSYEAALITRRIRWGSPDEFEIPLDADIYVAAYVEEERVSDLYARVVIVGWEHKEVVEKFPERNVRTNLPEYQDQLNLELEYEGLKRMQDLPDILGLDLCFEEEEEEQCQTENVAIFS